MPKLEIWPLDPTLTLRFAHALYVMEGPILLALAVFKFGVSSYEILGTPHH